jgi:ABC-type uncharacterized transport system permease subunit
MWETVSSASFIVDFGVSIIRMMTPLAYAGLACVISERAGVFNIGTEGMMLAGAFAAAVGALYTNSAWAGIGLALATGIMMGLLLAVLSIPLGANQIVSGIMINILSLGMTSFLARVIMGSDITTKLPMLEFWRSRSLRPRGVCPCAPLESTPEPRTRPELMSFEPGTCVSF